MKTRVTYYQLPMQQLFKQNLQQIQHTELEPFFKQNLVVPVEMLDAIQNGLRPNEQMFKPNPEGINALYNSVDSLPTNFFGVLDEGERGATLCAYSRHFFPNVTKAMMQWWFVWHPLSARYYSLWFPHAHVENRVDFPERLTDPTLSYAEKMYGNPNHVCEYIGNELAKLVIHFEDPTKLGVSAETLQKQGFDFSASGWISPEGADDVAIALMLHLGREVEGGFELINHYWIGSHADFSLASGIAGSGEKGVAIAQAQGTTVEMLLPQAYEMSIHDMTEYTRLGEMLPELYEKFGK